MASVLRQASLQPDTSQNVPDKQHNWLAIAARLSPPVEGLLTETGFSALTSKVSQKSENLADLHNPTVTPPKRVQIAF
jgi:hypothetical protein